ncbi:MAG: magnesium transporter CorA family protein [Fibromonadaceae bacterium]|jgi:magnesium transporter|nr:magnesium transporter CorA family protein [Fibromonadaceae bacterium]
MKRFYKLHAGQVISVEEGEAQVVVLVSPGQEEIDTLVKTYQIDDHTLNSAFDADELARMEYEDEHTAIIYKRPKNYSAIEHFQFRVGSAGLFLFKDLLIIVTDNLPPFADKKIFSKLNSLKTLLLKLVNLSVVHFNEHLRVINRMCNELEEKHLSNLKKDEYLIVFGLSKSLVYYTNAISSNETLLKKMQISRSLNFDENEQELLDDIIIENSQSKRLTEIYSNVLSNMMSSHEASHESSASGDISSLKILTILTIVIMIPTAVASLFSMNVTYPFNVENPITFWVIFILMMGGTFAFWLWLNKKKM